MIQKDLNLEQEILMVLTLAEGKGLKTEKIARHVFNACNSMFNPLDYKDIYNYVSQFLQKSQKGPHPIVEKIGYGIYRINESAHDAKQYLLQFGRQETAEKTSGNEEPKDLSLSLFDIDSFS